VDSAGRAFDNIMVERLWRTVKYKDVYLRDHQTPARARLGLARYFAYYNHRQRHRNLGRRTSARVYALEALPEEKSDSVIAFPPRSGIIETGDGRSAAARGAVAPGSFRNSSGNVPLGRGSTLFQPGNCPAHGDKLISLITVRI